MKLYVVGIGPGAKEHMTAEAVSVLKQSDVIVGYTKYIELIGHLALTDKKKIISSGMKKERERCLAAIDEALKGNTVSVVSSGDSGIYGMAGLICELAEESGLEICVVPGITAASSAAAVLGAPIMNDFAVVSLSDLLTDWTVIEKRIKLAAEADFVIVIYNPSSLKRADYLEKACKIIMNYRTHDTPCGFVRNISREGELACICTLSELKDKKADMFTTVIIGNSQTKVINNRLVTLRGYGE